MVNQLSPGVSVSEIDLTASPQAVATTVGAFAGHFRWGPVNDPLLITNEERLYNTFGGPNANTGTDFLMASSFLAYSNSLRTVRVVNEATTDPAKNAGLSGASINRIEKQDDYEDGEYEQAGITGAQPYIARWPGSLGNSLKVSICASEEAYEVQVSTLGSNATSATASIPENGSTVTFSADVGSGFFTPGDKLVIENTVFTIVSSPTDDTITVAEKAEEDFSDISATRIYRRWQYYDYVDAAPGTSLYAEDRNANIKDEIHVAVVDEGGEFTGVPGEVLEIHEGVSLGSNARTPEGLDNYYRSAINRSSEYVWWAGDPSGLAGDGADAGATLTDTSLFTNKLETPHNIRLTGGDDGSLPRSADYINGYNVFQSSDDIDVSIIIGPAITDNTRTGHVVARHVLENIANVREDVVVTLSPARESVIGAGSGPDEIVKSRNHLVNTSFGVMDSGWKLTYDKYNDVNRYIPVCADTAGVMVYTDLTRDPWFSPAGSSRGRIRNVIRLAFNPASKAERDILYKSGVNPIVTFAGEGTILFGDKTMLGRGSAFSYINVRRLFIILRKSIANASRSLLFEFNDEFTRAQFLNLVTPYLRTIQGRRGITDFLVVADSTNNPPEVIDRGEFVGSVFIKPARSINNIALRFVATKTGVNFQEIVGVAL